MVMRNKYITSLSLSLSLSLSHTHTHTHTHKYITSLSLPPSFPPSLHLSLPPSLPPSISLSQLERVEAEKESLMSEVEARAMKERHWSSELTQLTAELQLSREKASQLEREGVELKTELARLTLLLEDSQREVGVCTQTSYDLIIMSSFEVCWLVTERHVWAAATHMLLDFDIGPE